MSLIFVTGNAGKFSEAEAILQLPLTQHSLDLPEIQSLDPNEVMRAKLESARAAGIGRCIVEDSSLTLGCLAGKLPGPFIKWFEDALGLEGIVALTQVHADASAEIRTMVGYLDEEGDAHYFEGVLQGQIVSARGDQDFGYGPIFLPEGSTKTYGEMAREEKYRISSRAIAFKKLKEHLVQA